MDSCEFLSADVLIRYLNKNSTGKQQKYNTLPVTKQAHFKTAPLQKIKIRRA